MSSGISSFFFFFCPRDTSLVLGAMFDDALPFAYHSGVGLSIGRRDAL